VRRPENCPTISLHAAEEVAGIAEAGEREIKGLVGYALAVPPFASRRQDALTPAAQFFKLPEVAHYLARQRPLKWPIHLHASARNRQTALSMACSQMDARIVLQARAQPLAVLLMRFRTAGSP
jgi:hypothetical protein